MKTLVNKNNPALRITVPEIIEEEEYYTWDGENVFLKENWTLVEEEPTEGIKGNLEEIPSNVGLEKAAEEYVMQTASGTAEEMETLIDAFKAGANAIIGQRISLGYLISWYIQSVDGHQPIWTEEHLKELDKDFILIPKPLNNI